MTPGALIAKGRSADIFEYGESKVLRRLRDGRRVDDAEPAVMRAVRAAGYPVPEVFEVDGPDMAGPLLDASASCTFGVAATSTAAVPSGSRGVVASC